MAGMLAGITLAVATHLDLASALLGRAPTVVGRLDSARTAWEAAYVFLLGAAMSSLLSVGILFVLGVFQALVRSPWLARLLLFLAFVTVGLAGGGDPLASSVQGAILGAIAVSVLVRFGMLAFATFLLTFRALNNVSLTLDWSAWYAGPSFAVLGFFAALLIAAFHTSLGGKQMFGRSLLDE